MGQCQPLFRHRGLTKDSEKGIIEQARRFLPARKNQKEKGDERQKQSADAERDIAESKRRDEVQSDDGGDQ